MDRDLSAGSNGYSPRPPVTRKLDPYNAIIDTRHEEFPKLSAKRLFDKIRAAGYRVSYEALHDSLIVDAKNLNRDDSVPATTSPASVRQGGKHGERRPLSYAGAIRRSTAAARFTSIAAVGI